MVQPNAKYSGHHQSRPISPNSEIKIPKSLNIPVKIPKSPNRILSILHIHPQIYNPEIRKSALVTITKLMEGHVMREKANQMPSYSIAFSGDSPLNVSCSSYHFRRAIVVYCCISVPCIFSSFFS